MGWKGTVRSIGATVRAAERNARRRQRELERQQEQTKKMQELEQAEYEVGVYENYYVCSCVLRIANEIFSALPDDTVIITAVDKLLDSGTGHLEELPILSVCVSRKTLESLNLVAIDPSDSMGNFIYNMAFTKTKGFEAVSKLEPGELEAM